MIQHPSPYQLKLWIGGEATGSSLEDHIGQCPNCRNAVERLRSDRQAFLEPRNSMAFVNQVWLKATQESPKEARPFWSFWALRLVAGTAVLLVILFSGLYVMSPPSPPAIRTMPKSEKAVSSKIRLKGKPIQLAAIVRRKGHQIRHTSSFSIIPNDEMIIEVTLNTSMTITAGLLDDDDLWYPVMDGTFLEKGTHYSKHEMVVDQSPTPGWIIVGPPEAVSRAIKRREFQNVQVMRIKASGKK